MWQYGLAAEANSCAGVEADSGTGIAEVGWGVGTAEVKSFRIFSAEADSGRGRVEADLVADTAEVKSFRIFLEGGCHL